MTNIEKFLGNLWIFVTHLDVSKAKFVLWCSTMKKPLRLFEIDPCWSNSSNQTWANNSTWYCYSEITQKIAKIWGQIPGRIMVNNLPQVKYIDRVRLKKTNEKILQVIIWCYLHFWQYYRNIVELRLDLGHRPLIFALKTNLESGPRFAEIWFKPVSP